MITPESMSKVRIIVPLDFGYPAIDALYRMGVLHAREEAAPGLSSAHALPSADDLSKLLIELRTVKTALGITHHKQLLDMSLQYISDKELQERAGPIHTAYGKIQQLQEKSKESAGNVVLLQKKVSLLRALQSLGIEAASLSLLHRVKPFVGIVKNVTVVRAQLKAMRVQMVQANVGLDQLIIVFAPHANEKNVCDVLVKAGFSELKDDLRGQSLDAAKNELRDTQLYLKKVSSDIAQMRHDLEEFILTTEIICEEEVKKSEIPLRFTRTAQALIATGFIPSKRIEELSVELDRVSNGAAVVEHHRPSHHDKVPIKLQNPKIVQGFEALTRLYELPSYFEVDPTSLMFLTFPLFFGFMLGDVGYGLVTLALFMFLRKKLPSAKGLLTVLIYASFVSIAFGFMFGEYFGFERVSLDTGNKLCNIGLCLSKEVVEIHGAKEIAYVFPHLIARAHGTVDIMGMDFLTVLFIGIIVGAIHVNLGLLVGMYNVWHLHGIKHALLEKGSWIVMELSVALIILGVLGTLGKVSALLLWAGVGIFGASLVLLYLGEGAKGIIEIPGIFSNMLSYMRLGAVGLASVGLAVVINENLAMPFIEKGGIFTVIAIVIMVIGHAINIGLGVLGPFLHGLRLHYVEFFSKFFHGGGEEYKPFGTPPQ